VESRVGFVSLEPQVRAVFVLVWVALAAAAGDVITTFHGQAAGRGEATTWLAVMFARYPVGIGLVVLFLVRAGLISLGALSTNSRSFLWRAFGYAWLADLAVIGWYVVAHNLRVG
jgi:hypothetical protein